MKLAIFGYARSGTTMLVDICMRHLIAAGEANWSQNLGEPFNPLMYTRLVPYIQEDKLYVKILNDSTRQMTEGRYTELDDMPQKREDRFNLFKHASGDYVVKVLAQDTMHSPIVPWLIENGYHFITIERRNHFDALLSWLIAWNHNTWSINHGTESPQYKPFKAKMEHVEIICKFMSRYFYYKPLITNAHHLYYEDMTGMSTEETLHRAGIYREGVETPPTGFKKLLRFEEKVRFITNLDEVAAYYSTSVGAIAALNM